MVSNSKPGICQALASSCFLGFPGGRTRRWCRALSLLLPCEDRCTHLLSLPLLLEGQPITQKGCVDVGEVFQGHQLVPAGCPHPTYTPSGTEAPSQLSTTLWGLARGSISSCHCQALLMPLQEEEMERPCLFILLMVSFTVQKLLSWM